MRVRHELRRGRSALLPVAAAALAAATILVSPAAPALAAPATPMSPDAVAQAEATSSGDPVVVDADATDYSQVTANPDGSFTLNSTAAPMHVRQGNAWVPADATLVAGGDDTWSPRAATAGLALSGGGSGPLATFSDDKGHRLSVTMPMALPAPNVSGDTATYTGVLPGVDLSITATTDGGVHEVLVVEDRAAAGNPALDSLRLATTTTDLTVSTGANGAITASDPQDGTVVFTAPPPVMWDSAAAGTPVDTGDPATSSVDGPGVSATVTPIAATATSGELTLTPPATALSGPDVVYPAYLDPGISGTLSAWAYTQSYHSSSTAYKTSDKLRVGFDDWDTNCGDPCYKNGISRTFLAFNGLTAIDGKDVTASSLSLTQDDAACSASYQINAAIISGNASFSSSLDWSNQPAASGVVDYLAMSGTDGGKTINFDTIGPYMAAHDYTHVNLVLYASSESNDCTWRHFADNPGLSVTYWSTPNKPAGLTVKNGGASLGCNTASPGTWVPKATSNQVTLSDTVSTPDANTGLTNNIYLSTNNAAYVDDKVSVTETGANTAIPASKVITVADGSSYHWYSTAANSYKTSAASSTCYFRYDGTSPANPVFGTTDFPSQGPTTVTPDNPGSITLTSSDGGTNPSGLASIRYDIDGTGITSGGVTGSLVPSAGVGTVPLSLSQLHWGTNVLWAQATDTAGNLSSVESYSFYVQQSAFGPYHPGTAGDVDGNDQPDLVAVDAAGDIQAYSDPAPGSADPTGDLAQDPHQYGGRVLVQASSNARWPDPDSASAAGALIAHAGSFTGNNYDDLLVEQNGYLGIATNPGSAGTWTFATTNVPKPSCPTCTDYNLGDWSSVDEMIAVPNDPGAAPDLLTVETVNNVASVWLYAPVPGSLRFNTPTRIATSTAGWNWHNADLLGAGPLPGSTGATLWVRTRDTGRLVTFANITAGISGEPATAAHQVAASGYAPAQYPLMTMSGQADTDGNVPLWATDAAGNLDLLPTGTTAAGVTTLAAAVPLSTAAGWAAHIVALGDAYPSYNNAGIGADGTATTAFDVSSGGKYAYSATALADATLAGGMATACPPGWTSNCAASVGPGSTIIASLPQHEYKFRMPVPWTGQGDNYVAAGQVLPAPVPGTSGPAHTICFLGAGTSTAAEVTVPVTITYTDGGTQTLTLGFGDWAKTTVQPDNTVVATMDHRLTAATGAANTTVSNLLASSEFTLQDHGAALPTGVQIAGVTLGSNPAVHVFSIGLA